MVRADHAAFSHREQAGPGALGQQAAVGGKALLTYRQYICDVAARASRIHAAQHFQARIRAEKAALWAKWLECGNKDHGPVGPVEAKDRCKNSEPKESPASSMPWARRGA